MQLYIIGDFVSVTGSLITDDSSDESPYLSYILDGQDDSSFTLNTAVISTQSLYAAHLSSQGHHQLQMSLTNDRARLTIEGMTFTTNEGTDAAASERRKAKIAGGTVGAIVFLALCLLGFFLYRRRRIRAAAAGQFCYHLSRGSEVEVNFARSVFSQSLSLASFHADLKRGFHLEKPRSLRHFVHPIYRDSCVITGQANSSVHSPASKFHSLILGMRALGCYVPLLH